VQPGSLVRVLRATFGVPIGAIGLIIADGHSRDVLNDAWVVAVTNCPTMKRYLERDLEVINESR